MIETFPTADALADAAAHAVAGQLIHALGHFGRASLVGTGGRSPGGVYDRLASGRGGKLDWNRVVVTLSDERCVAPDAPAANVRLLRDRLLQGEAAKAHLIPLWPKPDPAQIAALQPFDAVILGMGEDGHIASLIPGSPTLAQGLDLDGTALILDTPAGLGAPPVARVTLTLTALLNARAIFLLIAGSTKREVLERAQAGDDLPVRALLGQDRTPVRVLWTPEALA